MKYISRLLVPFVLLLPISTYGGWHGRQGNTQEDTEWMKSSGDFGAQLLLIGDEKEFIKRFPGIGLTGEWYLSCRPG
jgi:hypothetical protein